ncbi:MAG TPA: glycosyltransferase family 4 protein [Actinomycetota bacterium]|nr:glycosyltransferase family 4 protein [Actinomycetota bacterium]
MSQGQEAFTALHPTSPRDGVGRRPGPFRWLSRGAQRRLAAESGLKILSIDPTYSLELIRERGLEHEITCRDLDGFFEHVWTVHPVVGASWEHSRSTAFGLPTFTPIAPRHTMVEGHIGLFPMPAPLAAINLAFAQMTLLVSLVKLVRREGIAAIRAGDPYYSGLFGLLLARLNGLPLVIRINANYDLLYRTTGELAYPRLLRSRKVEMRVASFVLKRADLTVAGSKDNLRYAVDNGADLKKSTLFPNGTWIDPIHFQQEPSTRPSVRDELGLGDRPFVALVSRLSLVKHPEDVIYTLAHAKRSHPKLAAVFIGDGPMRGELERLATELGVAEDVIFAGNRNQQWLASALADANVVLSPLTGRALVEACLSSTPVVAYDVEWHSEFLRSGENGILVPYRDTEAMATAVCQLLADPQLGERLGRAGRATAIEVMNPALLMEHERREYKKLLGLQ